MGRNDGKIKDRNKSMEVIFGNRIPGDILFVSEKLLTAYDTDYEIKKKAEEKIDHSKLKYTGEQYFHEEYSSSGDSDKEKKELKKDEV